MEAVAHSELAKLSLDLKALNAKPLWERTTGGDDEDDSEGSGDQAWARNPTAARRDSEPDRECRRQPDGLRRGMHLATVPSAPRV